MPIDVDRPDAVWNESTTPSGRGGRRQRNEMCNLRAIVAGQTTDSIRATRRINGPAAREVEKSQVGRKTPMLNSRPTLCSQPNTAASRKPGIPPTLLWIGCGSCSGESMAMLGVDGHATDFL